MAETHLSRSYEQIPKELRDLLDQVYTPEGVVVWWRGRNRLIGYLTAEEAWFYGRSAEVLQVAESLLGQEAT